MSTNKLLIAMAVVALAFAACFAVFDNTANDAADEGYTMTADYQVIEGKPIVHLTLNAPIFASPAFVTIAGESSTGEDYELKTVALFMNATEANVEAPGLTDGQYTVTLKTTITGEISADFRAAKAYSVSVRTSGEGTASVNPTMAYEGDTVTVTATAADDYEIKEISYNGKVITGTTFTMPATEVLVFVEFGSLYTECDVTFVVSEGYYTVVPAYVGYPIEKPADPEIIGAEFEGWYTEDGVKFDFETEIEGDMTLYAHFGPITPEKAATAVFIGATQTGDAKLRVTIDADEGYVPAGKITGKIAFAYQKEILPGVMVWETGYSDIEEITVTNEGQYGLLVGYIDLVAEHIEYANNFQLSYEVDGKVIGQTAKIEYASA